MTQQWCDVERWTINESFDGHYRPYVKHGGRSFWCAFDYAVLVAPQIAKLVIELVSGASPESVKWFPDLHRGMLRGCEALQKQGRELIGIRIEVRDIHVHPIDTTAHACEYYGQSFILSTFTESACEIKRSD